MRELALAAEKYARQNKNEQKVGVAAAKYFILVVSVLVGIVFRFLEFWLLGFQLV